MTRKIGIIIAIAFLAAAGLASKAARNDAPGDSGPEVADLDIWQLTPEELERRIERQLDAGEVATLNWAVLQGLDHRTGESTALLRKLDGKRVRLPGYVVPLEDYIEDVTEFLLVPWAGACIHTPPPPPNQMVHTRMVAGARARVPWWEPVWVEGVLHVIPANSPYGMVSFQFEGRTVRLLES